MSREVCLPVPARPGDLVRRAETPGFILSEARHDGRIELHAHAAPTLTLLMRGSFEERYPGRRAAARCTHFGALLRRPGELHEDQIAPGGALNLVVEIDEARYAQLPALAGMADARDEAGLRLLGERLRAELHADDEARTVAMEGLVLEVLAQLLRLDGRRHESEPVARARRWLDERFRSGELRIADVAAMVDMHPVSFARAFRSQVGRSPGEYVRELRLRWAADRLAGGRDSLADVALGAGFTDQSHFTRAFGRRFGVTPGALRRGAGDRGR